MVAMESSQTVAAVVTQFAFDVIDCLPIAMAAAK
jgi:hypothetical protein